MSFLYGIGCGMLSFLMMTNSDNVHFSSHVATGIAVIIGFACLTTFSATELLADSDKELGHD